MYDLIIVGSGPAGLTAGIYASRAELNTVLIEKNAFSGGQIINTYEVDNYPGFPGVTGFDLAVKFREHCDKLGTEFVEGSVKEFSMDGQVKKLTLQDGRVLESRALIIAAGAVNRKLNVPGEEEFSGKGVSYCATCDGAFYRGKTVAVAGGGDVAVEDAIFLARMCRKVYVIHRRDEFRAAKSLSSKLMELENVEILWNTTVEEIHGEGTVAGITVKHRPDGEETVLSVDGIFIAVGTMPSSELYRGYVEMDEAGYIVAGEDCVTSVPGIFAAGDIRKKPLKQIITAAADGANAITAVEKYLNGF